MEINAVLDAVRALDGRLDIVSDSTYVVHCWRDRWWEKWERNGWRNSQKKDVVNQDLWKPLVDEFRTGRLTMRWVKGHAGDPMNDLVDKLAVAAAQTQTAREGAGVPPDLDTLAADAPSASPASDPRVPAGHRLVVAGHRPPELGGYDDNPVAASVRRRLTDIVAAKRAMHPELVVLTGLGLGAEQLGAEAAADAGVPFVAVLPYPDPDKVWPEASRSRFHALLDRAASTVLLQTKAPESKQSAGAALARRDAWLARHADEAVAVWDGDDALVGRAVRSLRDHLGEEDVWVVSPTDG
jgi:ribonuclease HI